VQDSIVPSIEVSEFIKYCKWFCSMY